MYAKASQFSLPLAMLARDHGLSLLSELKEHWHEEELWNGQQKLQNGRCVWIEFFIAMAHCSLRALDLHGIRVAVLLLPTQ